MSQGDCAEHCSDYHRGGIPNVLCQDGAQTIGDGFPDARAQLTGELDNFVFTLNHLPCARVEILGLQVTGTQISLQKTQSDRATQLMAVHSSNTRNLPMLGRCCHELKVMVSSGS